MTTDTTSRAFFDALYGKASDPWDFASSSYELGRYERILQSLPHRRYKHAFEPGCSIGVLTERLGLICDEVEAMDISRIAVDQARERCSGQPNIHIKCAAMPDHMLAGDLDLIVFSEIGYYFVESQLISLMNGLLSHLSSDGTFLAAHWLGSSPDHLLSGDCVHQIILETHGLSLEYSERHTDFRLDRWVRR